MGPIEIPTERRCGKCGEGKPLTAEFFCRQKNAKMGLSYRCRECRKVEQRERYRRSPETAKQRAKARYERLRQTPEGRALLIEQSRRRGARWRERHPEAAREADRRYRETRKKDRARHLADLENARINARLRAAAEGREMEARPAMNGYTPSVGRSDNLHVEPLATWLEVVLSQDAREREEIAAVIGVNDRSLRRILDRDYETVTTGLADKIVWGYRRAVRIPPERAEPWRAWLEDYWRGQPGNGERLLRYIAEAERIATAGVVVDRIEDLWPELESAG